MERTASPRDLRNWRFQQALYRAYYDAHVRSRLLHETNVEERALERLRSIRTGESRQALADAARILDDARIRPAAEWRLRVYSLAEALFQSIRQQLSVERYRAIAVGRGATLDSFETPLNNGGWLLAREPLLGVAAAAMRRLAPGGEPLADAAALGPFAMLLVHLLIARAERPSRHRALGHTPAAPHPMGTRGKRAAESDLTPLPGWLNAGLCRVFSLEQDILRHTSLPFGASILAVARRAAES